MCPWRLDVRARIILRKLTSVLIALQYSLAFYLQAGKYKGRHCGLSPLFSIIELSISFSLSLLYALASSHVVWFSVDFFFSILNSMWGIHNIGIVDSPFSTEKRSP